MAAAGARHQRLEQVGVWALLIIAGLAAWRLQALPELSPDTAPLEAFPVRLGVWRSDDVPLEPAVESALGADLNLQRIYRMPTGDFVWLYIGYYGTEAGGRPAHTPRGCYPGAGWAIEETHILDGKDGHGLRINEYLIEQDGQRRLVHFWYRSHRAPSLLGGLDQNLDRLLGRLASGRADGALVRVSAPLDGGDREIARARLLGFARQVNAELGDHWPREFVAGEAEVAGKFPRL